MATQSETTSPIPTTQPLVVGQTGCPCGFDAGVGLIDEVRIYNRPLSAAEVQADMDRRI